MDRGLVENLDETAMNLCFFGFLCIFGIQYVCITNIARRHLFLFQMKWGPTYGCPALLMQKIHEIVCWVPTEWVKSKFLCQNADVMSLAGKCLVVGCFVCGDYEKIYMETGKFSNNIRVTENVLVLTACFSRRILRFRTSAIDLIHSERVSTSTTSFLSLHEKLYTTGDGSHIFSSEPISLTFVKSHTKSNI